MNIKDKKKLWRSVVIHAMIYLSMIVAFGLLCLVKQRFHLYVWVMLPLLLVSVALFALAKWSGGNDWIVIFTSFLIIFGTFTQIFLIQHGEARINSIKFIVYSIKEIAENDKYSSLNEYFQESGITNSRLVEDIDSEQAIVMMNDLEAAGLRFRHIAFVRSTDDIKKDEEDTFVRETVGNRTKKEYPQWDILRFFPKEVKNDDIVIGYVLRKNESAAEMMDTEAREADIVFASTDETGIAYFPGYEDLLKNEIYRREVGTKRGYPYTTALDLVFALVIGLFIAVFAACLFIVICGHYSDFAIIAMMLVNIIICGVMLRYGTSGDGSHVSLGGLQPLELIKICYVFVLVGLFCKNERNQDPFGYGRIKLNISRGALGIIYIGINLVMFICLSEFGTGLVLLATGVFLFIFFCREKRSAVSGLICAIGTLIKRFWSLAIFIVVMIIRYREDLWLRLLKVFSRICFFCNPESNPAGEGYHYIAIRWSLALTRWRGVGAERYQFVLPEQDRDTVFTKTAQMFGLIVALIIIALYVFLIIACYNAAKKTKDNYYRGLAIGCTGLLTFQTVVHLAYNVSMFPITGVPLMFISRGGSNQAVSLTIIVFILLISSGRLAYDLDRDLACSEAKGMELMRLIGWNKELTLILCLLVIGVLIKMI